MAVTMLRKPPAPVRGATPARPAAAEAAGAAAASRAAPPASGHRFAGTPIVQRAAAHGPVVQCGGVMSKPLEMSARARDAQREETRRLIEAKIKELEIRKAVRRVPREVTRVDALVDQDTGAYGKGAGHPKSHRLVSGALAPAGPGLRPGKGGNPGAPVTATDHLLGGFPTKGRSSRISFTNEKRLPANAAARDYSQAVKPAEGKDGEEHKAAPAAAAAPVKLRLKARKLMKARLKGKPDAAGATVHTGNDLLRQTVRDALRSQQGKTVGSAKFKEADAERDLVQGYVRRDAEVHAEAAPGAAIAPRFLSYSDRPARPHVYDSDSDSGADTEYSEDEADAPGARP